VSAAVPRIADPVDAQVKVFGLVPVTVVSGCKRQGQASAKPICPATWQCCRRHARCVAKGQTSRA